MNEALKKLNLIYKPFLVIALLFISGYTFLNWLLLIKLELFSTKEVVVHFGLPLTLPWIPLLIWMRPKMKLLDLKENANFGYMVLCWLTIAVPAMVAQKYVETASGELTVLENIEEYDTKEKSKYYQLSNLHVDKVNAGVATKFNVSGKHNDKFNMHIYISMPIFNSVFDTSTTVTTLWYGKEFYESIDNDLNEDEKDVLFQEFVAASQAEFDHMNTNDYIYLDRIGDTEDRDALIEAAENSNKHGESVTILLPVNEPFENRNGNKLAWIFGAFGMGAAVWLVLLMVANFNTIALQNLESGSTEKDEDLSDFMEFLIPRAGYFITPIIIYLNILIFLIMMISGLGFISFSGEDLLAWGSNYGPYTLEGEWWRLLSSTFLHGGIMHLLFNMYGLLYVGQFLEPVLGKTKFLSIYLITGILASVASLWWYDATNSVGASGAIFGMYGLFLALMMTKIYDADFSKSLLASTAVFVGYNLLMGLSGGIDNAAHIGGLLSGFIIGLAISPVLKKATNEDVLD